jgi:hypothetical protein
MKILLLIILACVPALAQTLGSSVCFNPGAETDRSILTICNKHLGMGPTPRVRLYLRIYDDGRAEYEENTPPTKLGAHPLAIRRIQVDPANLAEIKTLIAAADLQNADADYPRFRMWTDSGLETTITARNGDKMKKIFLQNYDEDPDNTRHYPASLNALLKVTGNLRDPRAAIVPAVLDFKGGILEVGKTYRGQVNFGDAYGMRLTVTPRLPLHHSVMYSWTNVKDFPALDPDKDFGVRWVIFKVADKEVDNFRRNAWLTTFSMEIVRVDE